MQMLKISGSLKKWRKKFNEKWKVYATLDLNDEILFNFYVSELNWFCICIYVTGNVDNLGNDDNS